MNYYDKNTFEFAKTLCTDINLIITDAVYSDNSFGSWYLEFDSNPVYRIVSDTKENWLVIEEKTDRLFNGEYVWNERWIKRNPKEEDLRIGVNYLKNIITGFNH